MNAVPVYRAAQTFFEVRLRLEAKFSQHHTRDSLRVVGISSMSLLGYPSEDFLQGEF